MDNFNQCYDEDELDEFSRMFNLAGPMAGSIHTRPGSVRLTTQVLGTQTIVEECWNDICPGFVRGIRRNHGTHKLG